MKRTVTFTFSFDLDGDNIGKTLGISMERAQEIAQRALELADGSKGWGETLSKLSEEFSGNEFLYVFGFVEFMAGVGHGRTDALLEVSKAQHAGRLGA